MDISKSGLKDKGLVMPGVEAETQSSLNTGDPSKLVKIPETDATNIMETKAELYAAQEKLVKLINTLLQDDHIDYEDRETLVSVSSAITKGINYLEHTQAALIELGDVLRYGSTDII